MRALTQSELRLLRDCLNRESWACSDRMAQWLPQKPIDALARRGLVRLDLCMGCPRSPDVRDTYHVVLTALGRLALQLGSLS